MLSKKKIYFHLNLLQVKMYSCSTYWLSHRQQNSADLDEANIVSYPL